MDLRKSNNTSGNKHVQRYLLVGAILTAILLALFAVTPSTPPKTIVHKEEPTAVAELGHLKTETNQGQQVHAVITVQSNDDVADGEGSGDTDGDIQESENFEVDTGDGTAYTLFNGTYSKTKDSRKIYVEMIEDGMATITILTIPDSACKASFGEAMRTEPDEKPIKQLFVFGASSWLDSAAEWLCKK